MSDLSLNGTWRLTFGPQDAAAPAASVPPDGFRTIDAQTPGNVELDLQAAGLLPDLARGDNIYLLRPFELYQWWYQRRFASPSLEAGQRVELVFDGLDCLGTCWLNGRLLGRTANMLIEHRFDITKALAATGENELTVRIDSAVLAERARPTDPVNRTLPGGTLAIRKAPHMYGWDIMPRVVSAGLWRGVRLEIVEPSHFRSLYFATLEADPEADSARIALSWDFATDRSCLDDLRIRAVLSDAQGEKLNVVKPVFENRETITRELRDVRFWWPRGYGDAHLYHLRVELLDADDRVLTKREHNVGIRTVELISTQTTTPDGDGSFLFRVNGERIFIRGTNWVPLDALHARDPQHLDHAIDMAVDLNCNMIRCWGGNVYEDHAFFDLCDHHGLLVWQDFALACAIYPDDDAFCEQVEIEAERIVTRLRLHPSLALWCGANETDNAIEWARLPIDPNDDRVTRRVLPRVVRRLDPTRPYLPNSPYQGPQFMASGAAAHDALPEQHLWGPRLDYKSPFYTKTAAHFASEIGYHGCPDRRSLEQFLDPDHLWPWRDNSQWLTHCVRPYRNAEEYNYRIPLMARQIAHLFGDVPEELDPYIFASQASQAEAMKFFIEFFRIGKWRRTGIVWWNLRDGWPIFSDAIVDYYSRKKLAYDYIQRIQADVCVIVGEPEGATHPVVAVNDTRQPRQGTARATNLDDPDCTLEWRFNIPANGAARIGAIPADGHQIMWRLDWSLDQGGKGANHYLAGKPPFDLEQYRRWYERLGIRP